MVSASRLRRYLRRLSEVHRPILWVMVTLTLLGLAMQYSAAGGDITVFVLPQLSKMLIGFLAACVLVLMSPKQLMTLTPLIYGICVVLLVIVEVMGVLGGGAQRWIAIGGFTLQPSEFAKLGVILMLARYFHGVHLEHRHHLMVLIAPLLITAIPAGLVLLQPNLGTATIIGLIAYATCFMAGIRWVYFAGTLGAGIAAVPIIYQLLHPYQRRRVDTFLDPTQDPLGSGYNIIQSQIAIGSGGFFGKGLVGGSQGQLDFLPEKQTDFIFTMLGEELGFFGALILLILYGCLLTFALMLAVRCRHGFGRMIAAGVATLLFVHIFINMGMVMGLLPVVGVPLPFLSYGGSFVMAIFMACGLLMHVYVHREVTLPRGGGSVFG